MSGWGGEQIVFGFIVGAAVVFYFAPTVAAFARGHAYCWVIAAINLVAGWTLFGWLAAAVWAVWPGERALAEPLIGNPSGTGRRTLSDVISSGNSAEIQGGRLDDVALDRLRRLVALRDAGALSLDEFQRERDAVIR